MSQTQIRIASELVDLAQQVKPRWKTTPRFIEDLLEQALRGIDSTPTITERPAGARSALDNSNKEKKEERARAREGYTPEFQKFWKTYQSCSHKANGQSKPKAFEQWRLATKDGNEAQIQSAIEAAIEDIKRRKAADEFAAPLPDCFRWLRDGHYEVHAEEHKENHLPPGFTQEAWDAREALYAELDAEWGVKS